MGTGTEKVKGGRGRQVMHSFIAGRADIFGILAHIEFDFGHFGACIGGNQCG